MTRHRILTFVCGATLCLGLTGCADDPGAGAFVGAATGGAIGNAVSGGSFGGTLAGAAIGGVVGAEASKAAARNQ